ncbi:MAG: PIG-L family deacetylase [Pyrinomonadaceae bacterium]|nr:PIG-L family deacetylase [Pyrinomonadaceae bacterium]
MSNLEVLQKSPLADIAALELQPSETVLDWGKTLIVAPHPDDESLGGGGAIALLREFQKAVVVLVLSDGTLSHPNSVKFPAEKLRDLREREMLAALEILGVAADAVTFFRFQDRSVPDADSPDFKNAVERCRDYLKQTAPQTILVPWRRDPHPDHRAAYSLLKTANKDSAKIIEYPIWLWEIAESADAPRFGEVTAKRIDISRVTEKKQRAIRAHASQTTDLIDDDPHGFRLTDDILANFADAYEVYLEGKNE